ncbi:hypothetical protein [Xenorhabdus bovienii]|uniref:hypothetical protein n=1 Tax=Xenorhabdus bovienii TaxID=40576 RepID=UPI0004D7768B|nr:hypothetical protein [Xenorhabdus bovienii]CDG86390.1 putative bacteriophage protein [Xenorhabdus bovienii str. feltiae France]CDG94402.1 putative bacteriophage protein [Xenorhabdus bovienii str. feltiae Florida]
MSGLKIRKDNAAAVLAALNRLTKMDVLVGIPSSKAHRGDGEELNNAEIGYLQSTGGTVRIGGKTVTLPPRPFLEMGIEDTKPITTEHLKAAADYAIEGKFDAAQRELEKAGMVAMNGAKKVISEGDRLHPLSEATLHRRKENNVPGEKPLYDTGSLLKSITYVVRNKGE